MLQSRAVLVWVLLSELLSMLLSGLMWVLLSALMWAKPFEGMPHAAITWCAALGAAVGAGCCRGWCGCCCWSRSGRCGSRESPLLQSRGLLV